MTRGPVKTWRDLQADARRERLGAAFVAAILLASLVVLAWAAGR